MTRDPSTKTRERGRGLSGGLDSEELGRLRGFLRASLGVGCASAVVYAALTVLLHDRRFAELLALAALFVAGNARALRLVGQGKGTQAAVLWSWLTPPIVIAAAFFVPFMFPSLIMMTLVATSLLISFVTGRLLRTMLAVNLLATWFIVAVGVLSPKGPPPPLWAARVLVLSTFPMTTGLILVVLAQFAVRIRAANERLAQRATEKAGELLRTEARVSALVESAMDGIVAIDADGRITEFNGAAERMFGKSRSDVIGTDVAEAIISPPLREAHRRGLANYLATGHGPMLQRPVELMAMRGDGTDFAVEASIAQVDRHGSAPLFTAFMRDITERKQAEAVLRESEQRLFQFAEQMPMGVHVVDTDGRSVFMNVAAEAILGEPLDPECPPEALPTRYRAYVAGTDLPYPAELTPVVRALKGERNVRVDDVEIRRPDRTIPLEVIANPILDRAGDIVYAISAFFDLSDHNKAEEKLRQAAEELEQARQQADAANQAKSEFLSRMSHELRTPLNAILGFAQLLELEDLSEQQQKSVGYVLRGGRHLLGLIDEVLDIAKIESGQLSLSIEPVVVRGVLLEIMDLAGPLAAGRDIALDVEGFDHESSTVLADRQRLKQVLLNLVSNAIKYNRHGGSVRLSAIPAAEGAFRLAVTDTGLGIPEEGLRKLFTAFERIGAEQTEVEGTGLGLSLSKVLVEAMGGTIGVETTVGEGSTFWFELPGQATEARHDRDVVLGLGEAVASQPVGTTPEPGSLSPTPVSKLLYIEDNLSNVQLVELLLAHRPTIALLSAMQGRMGLELARQHHPDLILLDLHLPDVRGDQVLAALRSHPSTGQIPVIVLTADATKGQAERLRKAGATDCLTKPLDLVRLLTIIDRYAGIGPEQN
ncbi:MAG: Histidine kinase [Actinobacteria bacterium]|nr:Histidine kinase [Actinomycetota bacterium]